MSGHLATGPAGPNKTLGNTHPPLLDTLTMRQFLSPDLHDITSICARFFVVISSPSLSGCYCLDIRWPVLYLEPTSGSELRGNLGESWAVSVRLGGSWHGAGGAGVNTDIT